jgi:hemolysin III
MRSPRVLWDGTLDPRPLLRGVSHQYALIAALLAGTSLVVLASGVRATIATGIYALSLSVLFATSAVYHRKWWRTPRARNWMRRLDHSAIFLLIAGTYTPFSLLALEGLVADIVLACVWGGAVLGIGLYLVWIDAPRWLTAVAYLTVGWAGLASLPQMFENAGVAASVLVIVGGALYTVGALVYAGKRPNPAPAVFGYHELFHALVIVAAATQFVAVALVVL